MFSKSRSEHIGCRRESVEIPDASWDGEPYTPKAINVRLPELTGETDLVSIASRDIDAEIAYLKCQLDEVHRVVNLGVRAVHRVTDTGGVSGGNGSRMSSISSRNSPSTQSASGMTNDRPYSLLAR